MKEEKRGEDAPAARATGAAREAQATAAVSPAAVLWPVATTFM